jgi:phosphoglycolate phosphatase
MVGATGGRLEPPFACDAVAFDMDGTLLVSREYVADSIEAALREMGKRVPGLPVPPRAVIQAQLGKRFDEFYDELLPREHTGLRDELARRAGEADIAFLRSGRGTLFPGVAETLGALKRAGFKLLLVSNCNQDYLAAVSAAFNFPQWIDLVDCAGRRNRTKGRVLAEGVAQLGAKSAVMVGDRVHDLLAARENGCPFVGVRYGYGKPRELDGADAMVDVMSELPSLLRRA